jgi:hypothetical protein
MNRSKKRGGDAHGDKVYVGYCNFLRIRRRFDLKILSLLGQLQRHRVIQRADIFNIYEANTHSRNNQAGLVKSILVNEIPLSLVFMILISSMKIED